MDKLINLGKSKGKSMIEQINMLKKAQNPDAIDSSNVLFMVDCSGSMGQVIQGKAKYLHMQDILTKMGAQHIISFGGTSRWIKANECNCNGSSTPMHRGFEFLRDSKKGFKTIVLISDGEVDRPDETMGLIEQFKQRIECIFIGEEDDYGYMFMKGIARVSGGSAQNIDTGDINFVHLLEEKITLLLEN